MFRNSVPNEISRYKNIQTEHKAGPFLVTFSPVILRKPLMKVVDTQPRSHHTATALNPEPGESNHVKVKVKVTLQQATKAQRGSVDIALLFL